MTFTDNVLDNTRFAQKIWAIPEMAHVAIYNSLAVTDLMRHLEGVTDLRLLAQRAADPNTPIDALIFLAGICPAEFCTNPVLPLLLLERPGLPAEFEPTSLGRLLSFAGVPSDFLAEIAQLAQPEFALAARMHIGLVGEASEAAWQSELEAALAQMTTIPEDDLLVLLLVMGLVPPWLYGRIALSHNARLLQALAFAKGESAQWESEPILMSIQFTEPALDLATLKQLLASDAPNDRARAAVNVAMTPDLLRQAYTDEWWSDGDYNVYEAIAGNPHTPPDLLLTIANDRTALNTRARRTVARHPATPPEALDILSDEQYAMDIPLAIAAHPQLSAEQRQRMAARAFALAQTGEDPFYHVIALANPDLPTEWLELLTRSPYWLERLAVAQHPNLPVPSRDMLRNDGNRFVRMAVKTGKQRTEM